MKPRRSERGAILVSAILITVVLFGLASAFYTVSSGGVEVTSRELATAEARLAAEEGLNRGMAEMKNGVDLGNDGLGTLTYTGGDGRTVTVTATDLGGNLYRFHSVAVLQRARAGVDAIVERMMNGHLSMTPRSGVTTRGTFVAAGNILIDGRNWNATNTTLLGGGTFAVSSQADIIPWGNARFGGNGLVPTKPPQPASMDKFANWADGQNEDNDAAVDEEAFDGIDNDGDTLVDEDTNDYPASPDAMLHLPADTLRQAAIQAGTYFATQAEFDIWLAANGGVIPGNRIIYADFQSWTNVQLGSSLNASPSILVHHTSTNDAQMNYVHGAFRGLLIFDNLSHPSGDMFIHGGMVSFGDPSSANVWVNLYSSSYAAVRLSSSVLGNLPSPVLASTVRVRAWNRAVAQ